MLPDYIIYDELKQERQREEPRRPRVELPQEPPPEFDDSEEKQDESEEENDRGVTIIEI